MGYRTIMDRSSARRSNTMNESSLLTILISLCVAFAGSIYIMVQYHKAQRKLKRYEEKYGPLDDKQDAHSVKDA